MPKSKGIFSEEEDTYSHYKGSQDQMASEYKYKPWRAEWKRKGPVEFAEKQLRIDPDTGKPLVLSEDQKAWLTDVCLNDVKLSIISAGRGSGKTFVIAVYITWRIYTHEYYNISCMGGSGEQSDKIQSYIRGWLRHSDDICPLKSFTMKDVKRIIKTFCNSSATFHSCSATSVRGPHVRDIIIDEEAAGEESGGTRYIKAALWEISTSEDLRIIKSSTPHLTFGDFLETWNEFEKLGFKRYQWAIAKHITGEKNPYLIFEDLNVNHWFTNVPWSSDETIRILRRQKSNEEWLTEALGAVSISSGLVFKPADLQACICNECEVCRPYQDGKCPLVQYFLNLEGMKPEEIPATTHQALHYVGERLIGIDWGKIAPDCYSTIGKFKDMVFVLDFVELYGQSDAEKISTTVKFAVKWGVEIIRPDPEQWSYANKLLDMGYAVHELFSFEGGQEKERYLFTLKKYIERHQIKIPKAFSALIRSLKNLTYDKTGKVRKVDDHPFDSLIYSISYYGEQDDSPFMGVDEPNAGARLWQPPAPKNVIPEPTEGENDKEGPTKEDDFNPFDEEFLKRRKRERGSEEGAKLW